MNFASQARNCVADTKSVPLSPFISLVCLQLRDEVEVKSPRTLEVHAIVLAHCMRLYIGEHQTNFKIRAGISRF